MATIHPLMVYRDGKKGMYILLSKSCLVLSAVVKQQQEQISRNHVPSLFAASVLFASRARLKSNEFFGSRRCQRSRSAIRIHRIITKHVSLLTTTIDGAIENTMSPLNKGWTDADVPLNPD